MIKLKENYSNDEYETHEITYLCNDFNELLEYIKDNSLDDINIHTSLNEFKTYRIEFMNCTVMCNIDIYEYTKEMEVI